MKYPCCPDAKLEGHVWQEFLWFVQERAAILYRRNNRSPRPWTEDPTLASSAFGNVWREMDRGTDWELQQLYAPQTPVEQVMFVLLYRHNLIPRTTKSLRLGCFPSMVVKRAGKGAVMHDCIKIWPGVWVGDKPVKRPVISLDDLDAETWAVYCWQHWQDVLSQTEWIEWLAQDPEGAYPDPHSLWNDIDRRFPKLGGFKSYEAMTSLTYLRWWPWQEDSFVHAGHGAAPAIRWLDPGSKPEHDASWLARYAPVVKAELRSRRGFNWTQHELLLWQPSYKFTARTLEDCLCEYRKWVQVRDGDRRPRELGDRLGRWG